MHENRSTVEQKKFYVRPEHLVGTQDTLVRSLTLAFAAAIEHGQRTGTRPTYKEMAGKHYVGAGAGLAAQSNASTNAPTSSNATRTEQRSSWTKSRKTTIGDSKNSRAWSRPAAIQDVRAAEGANTRQST